MLKEVPLVCKRSVAMQEVTGNELEFELTQRKTQRKSIWRKTCHGVRQTALVAVLLFIRVLFYPEDSGVVMSMTIGLFHQSLHGGFISSGCFSIVPVAV